MKQAELAKAVGMSEPTISKILSGKRRPSWRVAKALARETGSDVKIWMDGDPEEMRKTVEGR